jgi:hypothetical protein
LILRRKAVFWFDGLRDLGTKLVEFANIRRYNFVNIEETAGEKLREYEGIG